MRLSYIIIGIVIISLALTALKILAIWLITLLITFIFGFLLNAFLKILNARKYFSILMLLTLFALPFTGLAESDLTFYIVVSLFALSCLTLILENLKIKKSYKNMDTVKSDIDFSWIPIFANAFQLFILFVPSIATTLPLQIEYLDRYLYLNYLIYLFLPFILIKTSSQKLDLMQKRFFKNGIITKDEIDLECRMTLSPLDNDLEKMNVQQGYQDMIDHFENTNQIVKLDLEGDDYVCIETNIYTALQKQVQDHFIENKFCKKDHLLKSIELPRKIAKSSTELILNSLIVSNSDFLSIGDFYFETHFAKKISETIQDQIQKHNFNMDKFLTENNIDRSALRDLMAYFEINMFNNYDYLNSEKIDSNVEIHNDTPIHLTQDAISEKPKIDINKATESDFLDLGLGVIQTKKALEYRQEIGGFGDIDAFIKFIKVPPNTLISITEKISCSPIQNKNPKHSGRRLEI